MPITASFANKSFGGSRILGSTNAYNPQKTSAVDILLLAGGGGGGSIGGGAGGGGSVLLSGSYPVSPGTVLTIGIGGGGGGAGGSGGSGGDGGSSTVTGPGTPSLSTVGGGGGGQAGGTGRGGGCGGGGGRDNPTQPVNYGPSTAPGAPSQSAPFYGSYPNGFRGGSAKPAPFGGSGGGGGINGSGGDGSNGPNDSDERGGTGGNGFPFGTFLSSYNTDYRPPITKPYPNAPTHPVYAPLGISSIIIGAGGGGGIQGGGQVGGSGGDVGGGSGYPRTGGDGGNGGTPKRQANSGVQYSGSGGGGGGTGPADPWRDGGAGAGGRCIIRWSSTEFVNAASSTGSAYYHENSGYRHFDFVGSGTITF